MRSMIWFPAVAMTLLQFHGALAQDVFYSSGRPTSCNTTQHSISLTNSTTVSASLSPDNAEFSFALHDLPTVAGNATLEIALVDNNGEVYKHVLDPCSYGVPGLCPADDGVASFNFTVMEERLEMLNLSESADVSARFRVQIDAAGSDLREVCVGTMLRSNASGDGNDSTRDDGSSGDSTGSANETDATDTTQESGAGMLQAFWSSVM